MGISRTCDASPPVRDEFNSKRFAHLSPPIATAYLPEEYPVKRRLGRDQFFGVV
jgi:hypothetical protein